MLFPKTQWRPRTIRLILCIFLACCVWFYKSRPVPTSTSKAEPEDRIVASSSNSTIGFGQIYVISQKDSQRRHSLIQAANVTELRLNIPEQPTWTDNDMDSFKLPQDSTILKGSLLAWLGHIHALRKFLDSGAETALFLEDDVDWDIRLRKTQAPLVSYAVRRLLGSASLGHDAELYPYGDPTSWDLLYLGHCGDYWHGMDIGFADGHVKPQDLENTPHMGFADPSMLHSENLHPYTKSLMKNLGVPEYTRLVHRSVFPLCTFGYALSREGARRLLELGSKEPPGKGHKAYDVLILLSCRDYGFRCWTVNPELFHHIPGPSMIDGQQGNKVLPPIDRAAQNQIKLRGETPNINCGFWDGAFKFDGEDTARFNLLREEVGRKGKCLKKGRTTHAQLHVGSNYQKSHSNPD